MSESTTPENENTDEVAQSMPEGDPTSCGPSCECKPGLSRKAKAIICVGILLAAGVVLGRSVMQKSRTSIDNDRQRFAAVLPQGSENLLGGPAAVAGLQKTGAPSEQASGTTTKSPTKEPSLWNEPLNSLASLNQLASGTDAVFVLLSGDNKRGPESAVREIEAAARTIRSRGSRLAAFTLKTESPDFANVARQLPIPGVLVMVKGRGMSGVSGAEITEQKLIQAYVSASRPQSGCGPSSCAPGACK